MCSQYCPYKHSSTEKENETVGNVPFRDYLQITKAYDPF